MWQLKISFTISICESKIIKCLWAEEQFIELVYFVLAWTNLDSKMK